MSLKQKMQQKKKEYGQKRNIFNILLEEDGFPVGLKKKMQRQRKIYAIFQNTY